MHTALNSEDYGTRYQAAGELEKLGHRAEPAIPALIAALGDKGAFNTSNGDFVPFRAGRTLLLIGPPAVPALVALLKSQEEEGVRAYAMDIVARMGSDAYAALPVLQAALREEAVRIDAAVALWKMDPNEEWIVPAVTPGMPRPVEILQDSLGHKNAAVRAKAARALGGIGPAAKEAVPFLIKRIEDANSSVRCRAIEALGQMKQEAMPAVPALLKVLCGGDSHTRHAAAEALGWIRPRNKEVAVALLRSLKDWGANVPRSAAWALGEMGPAAELAVPALIEALKDPAVAEGAVVALGKIGPGAKSAVPALIQCTKTKDLGYREGLCWYSTTALGGIGPEARVAIPALLELFADESRSGLPEDYQIYSVAMTSLIRIGSAAVPALRKALQDSRPRVRALAARTLGCMGSAAQTALPALREALKDSSIWVRAEAAFALWRIDPRSEAAVPALLEALQIPNDADVVAKDSNLAWQISLRASEALHEMGPAARPALPTLLALLKRRTGPLPENVLHVLRGMGPAAKSAAPALVEILRASKEKREDYFHMEITWTLSKIGADAKLVVPALIAALGDQGKETRWAAMGALGRMGPAARPAVPALVHALRDPERSIRASAAFALGQIGAADRSTVLPLAGLLQDEEPVVRWAALTALEAFGPATVDAVPALCRLVQDRRTYIPVGPIDPHAPRYLQPAREDIWHWLGRRVNTAEIIPPYAAYQADRPLTVPERAIRVLVAIGPAARGAVPALLAARNEDRITVRCAAVAALKRIDPVALDKAEPSRMEMEQLWSQLADADATTAYRALWTMILAPKRSLPWLREHLQPIAPVKLERIAHWVRELDDEKFAAREQATRELEALEERAERALRAALDGKPSLEVRRRIERLLERLEKRMPGPERLRVLRAIAVLEKIETPEAREVLLGLSKGAAEAHPTQEARAALRRLASQRAKP